MFNNLTTHNWMETRMRPRTRQVTSRSSSFEHFQAEAMNGHCVKFDKDVLRKAERDNGGPGLSVHYPMDTMSVNSEIA